MAITNYTELKAAVAAWGKRSDLAALTPDFITLAEKRLNRNLLTRAQEFEVELTATPGTRHIDLPDGMINPVGLWLKAYLPRTKLTQLLPVDLPVKTNVSGYPEYWAIDAQAIALDKLAGDAYTFDFRYSGNLLLNDANPTNYVLTNDPDLYLFGALVELHKYAMNEQEADSWEARFQFSLDQANSNENDTRATAVMTTEIGQIVRNGRFNIIRGY